ncbi:MAG TPA: glutamate--tRNA ligase [Bacillota bacterium]|nr:glutamate--tRNA ligase [Bacillota bacterium]
MKEIRTRFAPSPTGYMHIGNLRTAIYEYLVAKTQNGKFILRIEDTDQERFVEGAIEVIYNTLKTVGLDYDEGPDIGGPYGPYIQSERKPLYREYAQKLVELGGAYYCFCAKERLERLRLDFESRGETFKYDGHCKSLTPDEVWRRISQNEPYVIRQKIPAGGETFFEDLVYGKITMENAQLDEGVLLKSDGMPTYNFANVVDDHLMQISHVVRGSEYLISTPKYNLIYQAFGWEIPSYIHLPPIMKSATKKLSKREGDASFEDFLGKGYLKEAIVNYIVLLGWNPGTEEEFFSLEDLKKRFTIAGLSKAAAVFDPGKLRWMNGEYLRRMSLDEFHLLAVPYYTAIQRPGIDLKKVSQLLQPRTEILSEIPEKIAFLGTLPDYSIELYVNKKMKTDGANSLENLKAAKEALSTLQPWEHQTIYDRLMGLVNQLAVKNGQVLYPLRIAVSGLEVTPGGAVELMELLGKDETMRRIEIGLGKLVQL